MKYLMILFVLLILSSCSITNEFSYKKTPIKPLAISCFLKNGTDRCSSTKVSKADADDFERIASTTIPTEGDFIREYISNTEYIDYIHLGYTQKKYHVLLVREVYNTSRSSRILILSHKKNVLLYRGEKSYQGITEHPFILKNDSLIFGSDKMTIPNDFNN